MSVDQKNKPIVLFWLRRHLRELEDKVSAPRQVEMAERGDSYGSRRRQMDDAESALDGTRVQIASVRAAIEYIEETVG